MGNTGGSPAAGTPARPPPPPRWRRWPPGRSRAPRWSASGPRTRRARRRRARSPSCSWSPRPRRRPRRCWPARSAGRCRRWSSSRGSGEPRLRRHTFYLDEGGRRLALADLLTYAGYDVLPVPARFGPAHPLVVLRSLMAELWTVRLLAATGALPAAAAAERRRALLRAAARARAADAAGLPGRRVGAGRGAGPGPVRAGPRGPADAPGGRAVLPGAGRAPRGPGAVRGPRRGRRRPDAERPGWRATRTCRCDPPVALAQRSAAGRQRLAVGQRWPTRLVSG